MPKLYHRELGLPEGLDYLEGMKFAFRVTYHAKQACANDRYGVISLPDSETIHVQDIFELELNDNDQITKIATRHEYKNGLDICLVFRPDRSGIATLVTAWLNKSSDKHVTLDKSKYARA